MGVEPVEIFDGPDPHILKWPKATLSVLWALTIIWAGYKIYFTELPQEEVFIRLIYMIIMCPLVGFIAINHKWAMTNAFAIFLCYTAAPFFLETPFFLWSLHLVWFGGLLTFRAYSVADDLRAQIAFERAAEFE